MATKKPVYWKFLCRANHHASGPVVGSIFLPKRAHNTPAGNRAAILTTIRMACASFIRGIPMDSVEPVAKFIFRLPLAVCMRRKVGSVPYAQIIGVKSSPEIVWAMSASKCILEIGDRNWGSKN